MRHFRGWSWLKSEDCGEEEQKIDGFGASGGAAGAAGGGGVSRVVVCE
jgi:hypothetical protein